jgi:ligand-binding SRPBCC domain-containing protein
MGQRYGEALMTVVRVSERVAAPPEEVWEIVSDPHNLTLWNRHIREVVGVPEHGLKEGSRYTTRLSFLGVGARIEAEVEEIDPPRFSRIRLSGPLDAIVRTWIQADGSGRSILEHEVDYHLKGGPVGALVARGLRLLGARTLLRRGIRAQKRQIESG